MQHRSPRLCDACFLFRRFFRLAASFFCCLTAGRDVATLALLLSALHTGMAGTRY